MNCINCAKYYGDCGYHYKDTEGHVNYRIPAIRYMDKSGCCMQYQPRPKTKHQFVFETSCDWTPAESSCWIECPFAAMMFGDNCRFKDKSSTLKCPFIE